MRNSKRPPAQRYFGETGGSSRRGWNWSRFAKFRNRAIGSLSHFWSGHLLTASLPIRTLVASISLGITVVIFAGCDGGTKPNGPAVKSVTLAPSVTPDKPAAAPAGSRIVAIAAASDLKFVLEEVIAEFSKLHPEVDCRVTFGSSGSFFAQLSNKAPFDLYLSADIEYPRKLIDQGLAVRETEFQYAIGHVVVWVPRDSPLKVEESGIETLTDPSVTKIAVANPKHAPYGRAAIATLKSLGVHDQVEGRLVMAENIAQAAQFVHTGAADVGLISLSLAMSPALKDKGRYWVVPESAYPPIVQGGVIMNWVQDLPAADQVRAYLLSDKGRAVLKKYGFTEPTK